MDEALILLCLITMPLRRVIARQPLRDFPGQWWFAGADLRDRDEGLERTHEQHHQGCEADGEPRSREHDHGAPDERDQRRHRLERAVTPRTDPRATPPAAKLDQAEARAVVGKRARRSP